MNEHTAENDASEREAIRAAWQAIIDADDWDADVAEDMYARAVDGIAWGLIEATMDTADREPSAEVYHEARNTARRMMFALVPRPSSITERYAEEVAAAQPVDGATDPCPTPGYGGHHTAVGAGAISPPYLCHGCGTWFTLPSEEGKS